MNSSAKDQVIDPSFFAPALMAATVLAFSLVCWSLKFEAKGWKSQSDEWKAKATESAAYAAQWEVDAKKALELAERCVIQSATTN